MKDITETRHAH